MAEQGVRDYPTSYHQAPEIEDRFWNVTLRVHCEVKGTGHV